MEKRLDMLKRVGIYSITITAVAMIISLIFKDKTITLGVGLGCMIGLIGFNMILQWGYSVETNSKASAFKNYLSRYVFYACMFGLSYYFGANILALLAGFMCHKIAIYIYSFTGK